MKWAIIGLGGAGTSHGVRVRDQIDGMELAGAYDPDTEARRKFDDELGTTSSTSLEDLLGEPDLVGVTVASSSAVHAELAIQSLQAGKHVLVEKPFAPAAADAQRMVDAARAAGRVVAPFHNRRFDPDFLMVRDVLDSGRLGPLHYIHSCVAGDSGPGGNTGWRADRSAGGGRLYDWGPHLLDQALCIVDSAVTDVWGVLHVPACAQGDADDYFRSELRFENGLDMTVAMCGMAFIRPARWVIYGETGSLQVEGDIHGEFRMTVRVAGGTPEVTTTSAQAEREKRGDGSVRIYEALRDHIEGKGDLAVTPEHAVQVARVMDAIRRSAEDEKRSVQP